MSPTPYELSTIASNLPTGSPAERVETALSIWQVAEKALRPPPPPDPAIDPVPLEKLLTKLMPKLQSCDRMKKWREFLTERTRCFLQMKELRVADKLAAIHGSYVFGLNTEDEVLKRVEATIRRQREGDPIYPDVRCISGFTDEQHAKLEEDTMRRRRERGFAPPPGLIEEFTAWYDNYSKEVRIARAKKGPAKKAELRAAGQKKPPAEK